MEFIVGGLAFFIISVWIPVLYLGCLKHELLLVVKILLVSLIPGVFLVIFLSIYTPAFFFVLCATVPAFLLTLLLFAIRMKTVLGKNPSRGKSYLYVIGLISVALFQLSPFWGVGIVGSICNQLNKETAMLIVPALENYKQETGEYPSSLNDLVPSYIMSLPVPTCFEPYDLLDVRDAPVNYFFTTCQRGENILATQTLPLGAILRYNLSTHNWSDIGVFDGPCGAKPIE